MCLWKWMVIKCTNARVEWNELRGLLYVRQCTSNETFLVYIITLPWHEYILYDSLCKIWAWNFSIQDKGYPLNFPWIIKYKQLPWFVFVYFVIYYGHYTLNLWKIFHCHAVPPFCPRDSFCTTFLPFVAQVNKQHHTSNSRVKTLSTL